jgi:hypothetical protein
MILNQKKDPRCVIKPILITLAILVVISYSGLKLKDLLIGPQIVILSPSDGATIKNSLVTVRGHADRITQLYLNGKKIFTDEQGNFDENYLLASGYNLLEIIAHDQFGRKTIKKLQLTTL